MRPAGLAAGGPVLLLVAAAAATVGLLTGAAPVLAVTAFLLTVAVLALAAGAWALRGTQVTHVDIPAVADMGVPIAVTVHTTGAGTPWVALSTPEGEPLGEGLSSAGVAVVEVTLPRRGHVHALRWQVRTTDAFGLMWWRRRGHLDQIDVTVAPPRVLPAAPTEVEPTSTQPDTNDQADSHTHLRSNDGDVDDLRPFHTGDPASGIAWAASLRSRRLLTHQRSVPPAGRTVVPVPDDHTMTPDAFDHHLGRVRTALHQAVAGGGHAAVRTPTGAVIDLDGTDAIDRWVATCEPLPTAPPPTPWWRRAVHLAVPDPEPRPSRFARVLAAATVGLSLWALLDAIAADATTVLLVAASLAIAVAMCSARRAVGKAVRLLVGATLATILFATTADLATIRTPFDVLQGALPQLLVALMVLQNFEAIDRRGNRVALCMSAMVMAYAAGLRVDPALAATVAAWAVMWALSMHALARTGPDVRVRRVSVAGRGMLAGAVAIVATVVVLQFVAIPAGPARLTMPTIVDDADPVANPGLLGGLGGASSGDQSDRAPNGRVGGYPGFSPTMDTSTRGPLGDDVVLRVRAPYPDFWRGQTFTTFDGQVWRNDEIAVDLRDGNQLELYEGVGQPSLDSGVRSEQLIQTFYLETDVPNLVFAAPVADLLVIDARAGQRPDGTIITDVVLPEGTVYSVVSHRAPVTPERLRAAGDVSTQFAGLTGDEVAELQLPASTTERTRQLARQLATGSASTYDTVLQIEQWLGTNVQYDLDAPVPSGDADAVDHFLFESRLGFCEQIASAMTIMLRSLGVPARVATGYVPSERDEFTGMWLSRASDAHAWVEVYFPGLGWQGFDPTAEVPLAGEAPSRSIGDGLARAAIASVRDHAATIMLVAGATAATAALAVLIVWARRRLRRGRWGRLQDRFAALAVRRGAAPDVDNAALATAWRDHEAFVAAQQLAATLDASAFDPHWRDTDDAYRRARISLDELGAVHSRP